MYIRKILFKCNLCGVEENVDTQNSDYTPSGWASLTLEIRKGVGHRRTELACRQHLCPNCTQRIGLELGDTGWHQNDVEIDSSPLKLGADPKPLHEQDRRGHDKEGVVE